MTLSKEDFDKTYDEMQSGYEKLKSEIVGSSLGDKTKRQLIRNIDIMTLALDVMIEELS